ncbi:tetratricopeptide repeat protein [Sphingoaurantiacus capsulatus]|uniref:Tetratricopeptide repeat protein n=1 Tax=Sphingoaurantiacus capsulatus TaxID=1771310 RepID=A0ABV7X910_9SPHN
MVRTMLKSLMCVGLIAVAMPAAAQDLRPTERRIDKLESEMRAVQRKVFPGGDKRYFEPEFQPTDPAAAAPTGVPASSPITDLTARVDALERQLQSMTGQVEQATFKTRQLEEALTKFRTDTEYRLTQLEGGGAATTAGTAPGSPAIIADSAPILPAPRAPATATPKQATPATTTPAGDAEAAYQAAYASVVAKDNAKAVTDLTAFVAKYPKSTRVSMANYWVGRSLIAQGDFERAARVFFDNQQKLPTGDRAQESLYWLGDVLVRMDRAPQACKVYDLANQVYGADMKPALKPQFANARTAAKCAA